MSTEPRKRSAGGNPAPSDPDRVKVSPSHPALSQPQSGDDPPTSGPLRCVSCGHLIHSRVNYLGQQALCPECHCFVRAPTAGLPRWVWFAIGCIVLVMLGLGALSWLVGQAE